MRADSTTRRVGFVAGLAALVCLAATGCGLLDRFSTPGGPELSAGADALAARKGPQAVQAFDKALAASPTDVRVYAAILGACQKAKRWDLAAQYAERGYRALPPKEAAERAQLASAAGSAYLQTGQIARAAEMNEAARNLAPGDPSVLNNLAYTYAEMPDADTPAGQARLKEALEMAQKAIAGARGQDVDEQSLATYLDTVGWIKYRLGQYDDALGTLSSAADMHPTEATILYHLGMAYQKKGRTPDARVAFERSLNADPAFEPSRQALEAMNTTQAPSAMPPRPAVNPLTPQPPAIGAPGRVR